MGANVGLKDVRSCEYIFPVEDELVHTGCIGLWI